MVKLNKLTRIAVTAALVGTVISPSMAFAATKHKAKPPKKPPVLSGNLVALGDSITFGYNLGDNQAPSPKAFPYLIGKAEHMATVKDLGVPGWTSTDLLNALTPQTQTPNTLTQTEVAVENANVVTIEIGSNDLLGPATPILESKTTPTSDQLTTLGKELTVAVTQLGTNVASIVTKVQTLNPKATIVLYDIYDPIPSSNSTLYGFGETAVGAANLQIASIALQDKVIIADAYGAFHNHPKYILPNDVHPTVVGQKVLANQGEIALQLSPIVTTTQGWQSLTSWFGQQIVNLNHPKA